ncbi:MAG: DUF362 domain-containing protein [Phycisphaerae bacterium]
MNKYAVSLTRCNTYSPDEISQCLKRHFELLGGISQFIKSGDKVLLKPNLIAPKPRGCATQTDPQVIIELAKMLKDYGAKPFVGDSPAWANVYSCVKKLELDEPLKKLDVPVKQLNHPRTCVLAGGLKVGISSIALDSDVIINLPKFKSHQQLVATFAVKNMFGCVSGKAKALWHFKKGGSEKHFCRLLIDVYSLLKPALTIIDGVIAMDGPGPINGRARRLGWLIAGTEPIAMETVCARIINREPEEFPIIKTARQSGLGCIDEQQIQIVGDNYKNAVCLDFERAKIIPIRFSLLRVCKSTIKQLLILLKLRKT